VDPIRRPTRRIRGFIDEAWSELKKVSWPTRRQAWNLTVLVLAVSFSVGLFITAVDFVFLQAVKLISA
jgi:preprotein translocase subunit SecE